MPPLTGGKLVLATLAVALATFMNVLDSSIANVAIPTIAGNLGVSVDEGTWVITLFAAANAISIPLTGWLTQRVGQIKLFVWRDPAVRALVVAVRHRAESAGAARRAHLAGRGRGAADSAVAGDSARLVSEGEELARAGAVGDDGDRRPDRGARARRLDHRQLFVVVDLLHQHSGRAVRRGRDVGDLPQARDARRKRCRSTRSG